MVREMESLGVNLTATEADKPPVVKGDTPLTNQTVLFTGALQSISRKEAQALAEEAGAKIASGVSSKLNILVVGENPGSKLEKAKTISSIEVLTEGEFLQRLKTS